jgi:hypothetical protein
MSFPTFEQVMASRNLADTSIEKYKSNLKIVKKLLNFEGDNLSYINRSMTIFKALNKKLKTKEYSVSTVKSIYTTLFVLARGIKAIDHTLVFKRTPAFYKLQMETFRNRYNELVNENTIPDIDNWMTFDEIKTLVQAIPTETYEDYLSKVVMALYTYIPPVRLDYCDMKVYSKAPSLSTPGNYCIFNKTDGFKFVLNKYKTYNHLGQFQSRVSPPGSDLYKVLSVWFTKYNVSKKWLLEHHNNKHVTKAQLSKIIYNVFDKYTHKKIGLQRLRKIYETELITSPAYALMSTAEKEYKHREVLHSFNTAQQYLVLNN